MRKLKIIIAVSGLLVAGIALFGVCLRYKNTRASADWLSRPAPPGRLIDIGGKKIYATVKGRGGPVIIIEAALGSSSAEWRHVQDRLSAHSTVVTYDRAGYGRSEKGKGARSADVIAGELHSLLNKSGVLPPFVLVGHDIGALYTLRFAQLFPGKVRALVLMDPFPLNISEFKTGLETAVYKNFIDRRSSYKIGAFFARTGIVRGLRVIPYKFVPADLRGDILEHFCLPSIYETALDEYRGGLSATLESIDKGGRIPGVPIIVLTRSRKAYRKEMRFFGVPVDEAQKLEKLWGKSHRSLRRYSDTLRIVEAGKSADNMQFTEPDLIADLVRQAIKMGR